MTLETALTVSIVAALLFLGAVAAALIAAALRVGGRLEERPDDHEALAASRFTIPVSVIVPAETVDAALVATVRAALSLSYPELEVIVVTRGAAGQTVAPLDAAFQLEAREFFYRRALETAAVRRIYRSAKEPRLTIIDTPSGSFAEALNSGVNLARYRYVIAIPPDITFEAEALLRIMAPAFRDPSTVVAVSNHVESGHGGSGAATAPMAFLGQLQRLSSVRALLESRVVWTALRRGLGPAESIVVWRRDAVLNAGGFSATAADPSLDLMYRVQTLPADRSERVVRRMDVFGRRDPESIGAMFVRAGRRQRAALQLLRALFRPTLRSIGPRAALASVTAEVLAPMAQLWVVAGSIIGAVAGVFSWYSVPLAIAALGFGQAAVTSASLLVRGASPDAPEDADLRELVVASALEIALAAPVRLAGRLTGLRP
jgi:poly-beta-1,6-N-acetyl-D-glucosamine synthase